MSHRGRCCAPLLLEVMLHAVGGIAALVEAAGGVPSAWDARGMPGGGAFFNLAMHPEDANLVALTTDMGVVFRSESFGDKWTSLPWVQVNGGRAAAVTFTRGSKAFVVNSNQYGVYGQVPSVSTDRGQTWAALPSSAGASGQTQTVDSDLDGKTLLLSDSTSLHVSGDGGHQWATVYNASSSQQGLRPAGSPLFTKSGWVLTATNDAVMSIDPSLVVSAFPWPNASEALLGFAAAEAEDGSIRAYALTALRASVSAGMMVESAMSTCQRVYTTTLASPSASGNWLPVTKLPALAGNGGALGATFLRMAPGDVSSVYLAGMCMNNCDGLGPQTAGYPFVMKADAGGDGDGEWVHIFRGSNNTRTGWEVSRSQALGVLPGYSWCRTAALEFHKSLYAYLRSCVNLACW